MSVPAVDPAVPAVVARIAGGRPLRAVWANEIGGTTWRIGAGERDAEFVKVGPPHPEFDPELEAAKLGWAREFIAVPEVLGAGVADGVGWLHTRALAGRNTIDPLFSADPGPVIDALGIGLRRLHETAPVTACPWRREPLTRLSPAALAELGAPPPVDRLVVCHGDPCAPNTIVGDAGGFVGLVDLGELGVGDRWSDLGAAHWSLEHNFGPGWWPRFLASYGIPDDPVRRAFHRRVWELG
ncbi:aminoglycoside phosphotransferase APH(3') [Enemella evansiae]|uniref:aminoglycoside 3'-phosphotransferase n=1 Tax=Enemella evansiae TaxID=2016499 RepID=UPI000B96A7E2|nr:aminoglycoside 3'-phosphotransferase [Enemella evansiae]OYO20033.1 aminoglycoside phosphotransferase APH(3') [Enemella evansiae]